MGYAIAKPSNICTLYVLCIYYLALPCVYHYIGTSSALTLNHTWQKVVHIFITAFMDAVTHQLTSLVPRPFRLQILITCSMQK